ncbi:MAG: hypothetical protein IPL50_19110 [Chitinophagaceae bacterium]|nr:hypothetical protein [Chitinophagaceae bacterium]
MMADISRLSTGKGRPIWGCDQSFGALHILTALLPFAKSKEARDYTQTYIDSVRLYENDRDNNVHFLSGKCKADDIKRLKQLYSPIIGSYPDWLLHTLEVSQRVYKNYMNGTRNIPGGYYLNGYEREEYMKERIMEEYNYALQMDKELPRVLLKFGQWHVMNGLGPSKLVTTGNFVRALAKINGLQSFYINMKVFNDPALASQASSVLSLFAKNCNINEWTLIDLRPLRWFIDSIKSKKLIQEETILEKFHDFIYTNDALLLFGNGKMGTYKWKENK